MRFLTICFLAANLLIFSGCGVKSTPQMERTSDNRTVAEKSAQGQSPQAASPGDVRQKESQASVMPIRAQSNDQSLTNADSAQAASQAIERKIIRNGKLTIETDSPTTGQQKITTIVESLGGFVITSDFKQGSASSSETVIISIRVPASQFNETLEKIRKAGDRVLNEN